MKSEASHLPLVLASSSKTRKSVLEKIQIPFTVAVPDIDETPNPNESPQELVLRLSLAKARRVAEIHPQHLIIGSDQVAVHNNQIVGKPKDRDQAINQLQSSSGKIISLYTGLALLNSSTGSTQSDVLQYQVYFRKLTQKMILDYIDRDKPYDCGGSLRSEGLGIALLKKFEGDDPNILLGLPLIRLIDMLCEEQVFPLQF